MKNVLVLAAKFPPTSAVGGIRSLKFVKYLPDFGWNPIVITPSIGSKKVLDDTLLNEIPPAVEIHRSYFLNYRKWIPGDIAKLIKSLERNYVFPDKYI